MSNVVHPTLEAAASKTQLAHGLITGLRPDASGLKMAMDALKSARLLVQAHHTVLVELEDQVPEPGPALFDGTGQPAPGAQVSGLGLRIEEHPVLTLGGQAYSEFNGRKQEILDEELLFALRLHARARGLDYDDLRNLLMDDLGGFDQETWDWACGQILNSGDFDWPHKCEDCQCVETPGPDGTVLCWTCKRKREEAARAAAKRAEKAAAKRAEKKTQAPKSPGNPLVVCKDPECHGECQEDGLGEEGGEA